MTQQIQVCRCKAHSFPHRKGCKQCQELSDAVQQRDTSESHTDSLDSLAVRGLFAPLNDIPLRY